MATLFVTLVVLGASAPAVVSSDPCYTFDSNKRGVDFNKNMLGCNGDNPQYYVVPTRGHFHIWNMVSTAGDSLLALSQGDKGETIVACSGLFSKSPAQFNDTTVYPTLSLSIKFATSRQGNYHLSIHHSTKALVVKDFNKETINDYDRFIPWVHGGFMMFESKSHPSNFLGCTNEGAAQLFYIHNKYYPDPRSLFVINNVEGN